MKWSHESLADALRYVPGEKLSERPTRWEMLEDPKDWLKDTVEEFEDLQEKLYADDRFALLLIFQGMDAAGKDSTIKRVTSGVNPAGFEIHSFKQPTYEHLDHAFMWRHWGKLPARGRIGIFNRSYYEEALVVRVHPEILLDRKVPELVVDHSLWQRRFADFRATEAHLDHNGVKVVKFFLNVSKDEQKERLLARLDRPEKHWKFNPRDVAERAHWAEYQNAFQEALENTHTDQAPWYVVPADDKPTMRAAVASIIVTTLQALPINFPEPDPEDVEKFDEARKILESS